MRAGKAAAEIIHEGFAAGIFPRSSFNVMSVAVKNFSGASMRVKTIPQTLLTRNKEDQIDAYGLIRDYIDGGESKFAAFKSRAARSGCCWDYLRFKVTAAFLYFFRERFAQ